MAESLTCDICGKSATVHLTQIVNNKIHKVDLCETCAQGKGIHDSESISFSDILEQTPFVHHLQLSLVEKKSCPNCHYTAQDFKNKGLLGCSTCYEVFTDLIQVIVKKHQRGSVHEGKVPVHAITRVELKKQIRDLESEIAEAIRTEHYEDAARIRDEIQKLQK